MSFANNLIVARDARKPEALEVRYQIERELGAGSGSTVYQALRLPSQEDAAADESRRVALKISTSPRWKGRLTDEAAILKKLSENQRNRRVVHIGAEGRVLQAQSALGDIWMIELEYLEGQTLRDWFDHHWTKAQPSPEQVMDEILELATQLAEGLVELEGPAGSGDQILHRDLKPENLMRTPQGLRLFDFNVSKERTESQFTEVGTRGYQAPEVSGARYDHRIDFWSLGVILWEVLHQRRFDLLVATREHQGEYQLRWPTQRSQSLPKPMEGALGALLGRLLAPVGARFETAQLLLEEIQLLRQQQGTSLRNAVVGFDMIQLLAQLSPSGLLAVVSETDTRGELHRHMKERMHVHDPLEDWLFQQLRDRLKAAASGRPSLMMLAGNAGDGKSHLLRRVRERLERERVPTGRLRVIVDATHALEPNGSQQERLRSFFAPFAEGAPPDGGLYLVAMNTGMVIRFFDSEQKFDALKVELEAQLGLRRRGEGEARPPWPVEVVNLDLRDLMDGGEQSFAARMLHRLRPDVEEGISALK